MRLSDKNPSVASSGWVLCSCVGCVGVPAWLGFYRQMVGFFVLLQWLYDKHAYSEACGKEVLVHLHRKTISHSQKLADVGFGFKKRTFPSTFSQLTLVSNDLSATCTFVAGGGVYPADQTPREAITCSSSSIHVCSSEYESAR